MSELPIDARQARFDLFASGLPGSPELLLVALKYLNLCSEEFYLRRVGHLDKRIWKIWEPEMKRTIRSPLIREEWHGRLKREFDSYPEFQDFVDCEIAASTQQ